MAEWDYSDFDAAQAGRDGGEHGVPVGQRMQSWINGAGAVTSLALIVGLGLWGYKLAVRDVSGIPVIRALEGPARIAPEDPGGELALHQGLAVNEIAADGTAAPPAGRLTLAPKADDLSVEDQPMGGVDQTDIAASQAAPSADLTGQSAVPVGPLVAQPAALRPNEPLPDGPAEQVTEGGALAPTLPAGAIATDIPGIAVSPRPVARPVALRPAAAAEDADDPIDAIAEAAAAAVAAALAPPEALDLMPDELVAGVQLVQIGAYPDEAQARLAWDRAVARFGALMDGKRRVIETAESGGEAFYRLRVEGFVDAEDARRFCAALKADSAECVPAVVR